MKSTIHTLVIALILLVSACSTDTTDPNNNSNPKENTEQKTKHIKSSKAAVVLGMWHYAIPIAVNPKDAEKYKGRWIQFNRDDTFTSGIYLDQTNSGTWSFDDALNVVKMKFDKDEDIETEWAIQGSGEVIIWKGNTEHNKTGMQIKMTKQLDGSRPGK
ncbi:MAG TPA: hypothetical protein ENJ45_03080 [Phaeodactylibacter sp.]|nr:hypothetical protein [Phaeodactylibacter sp.]